MNLKPDVNALERELRGMSSFVDEAIVNVSRDKLVDMRAMEKNLGVLCTAVEKLGPEDAQRIEPLMAEMIGKLETLATEVKNFQERNAGGHP